MSKDNGSSIIRLAYQAFGNYKFKIAFLTVLSFLSGFLEGIGINAFIPLFSFVSKNGQKGDDFISKLIESFFSSLHVNFNLKYLLIFVSLLFIFRAVILVYYNYAKVKISADYKKQMRNKLFNQTISAKWPYLLRQKSGYLETVLLTDISYCSGFLDQISSIIMVLTSLLMYTLVAVNISGIVTLMVFILGALIFLAFRPVIYRTRALARETGDTSKTIVHFVNQSIVGIKTIKAMANTRPIADVGARYFDKLNRLEIKLLTFQNLTGAFTQPIGLIFICIVFAFFYKLPSFNFAALIAIIYLVQRIFTYIQQLQNNVHSINSMAPYLRTVLEYQEAAEKNLETDDGRSSFIGNNLLEFKNVDFSYQDGSKILSNVCFDIKKGEMVGLIGPSGAGKTTLVDIILRLLNPISGEILLDGKNITGINMSEWRKNIGYVSQDIFLMNDTIANNIKFYDDTITDAEVSRAAEMAQIYDFVQGCPDKFSTVIGERGIMLSGGQRQRIIIARILARQPQFLILDEATSALDNESERKVQEVIKGLKGKITVLVIAHRLSTVINADRLIVLENGKVIEEGTPRDLLRDNTSYFAKAYSLRE